MPRQIRRPTHGDEAGAASAWRRRILATMAIGAVLAVGAGVWVGPASIRNGHERRYCRSQQKAIVANHAHLVAEGSPDPFYDEHFVIRQDYMDRCLAVQRCQRHWLFGLEHGPRAGCSFATADPASGSQD